MKSIKIRKLEAFWIFFPLLFILFGVLSCASDEVTVNEGVADDGTPLGPGTELSAGLEEDIDPDTQLVGLEPLPQKNNEQTTKEYRVTAHYLNVRGGPANSFPVVRVLKKNQIIKGLQTKSGWIKLSSDEYVSPKFLKSR